VPTCPRVRHPNVHARAANWRLGVAVEHTGPDQHRLAAAEVVKDAPLAHRRSHDVLWPFVLRLRMRSLALMRQPIQQQLPQPVGDAQQEAHNAVEQRWKLLARLC
jgi:hypothetical protein